LKKTRREMKAEIANPAARRTELPGLISEGLILSVPRIIRTESRARMSREM